MSLPNVKAFLMTTLLALTVNAYAAQPVSHDNGPKNYNEWTVAQLEAAMASGKTYFGSN